MTSHSINLDNLFKLAWIKIELEDAPLRGFNADIINNLTDEF